MGSEREDVGICVARPGENKGRMTHHKFIVLWSWISRGVVAGIYLPSILGNDKSSLDVNLKNYISSVDISYYESIKHFNGGNPKAIILICRMDHLKSSIFFKH